MPFDVRKKKIKQLSELNGKKEKEKESKEDIERERGNPSVKEGEILKGL